MRQSAEVREAMLSFYDRLSANDVGSFDQLVSQEPAALIIGTAPGEWVTERDEPVPAPAQGQPRGLVPVGRGGSEEGAGGGQADPALRRLLGLPLVPRHGARVLRRRGDRADDERALRQHQSRPRGAAGHWLDLHVRRPGAHPRRRLADDRLPHPGRSPVLRRHLLPADRSISSPSAPSVPVSVSAMASAAPRKPVMVAKAKDAEALNKATEKAVSNYKRNKGASMDAKGGQKK